MKQNQIMWEMYQSYRRSYINRNFRSIQSLMESESVAIFGAVGPIAIEKNKSVKMDASMRDREMRERSVCRERERERKWSRSRRRAEKENSRVLDPKLKRDEIRDSRK